MKNVAIILAAGQGKRMKAKVNKQFLTLGGKTILERTLGAFDDFCEIDAYILVAHADEVEFVQNTYQNKNHPKLVKVICGGKERQNSVYNGLCALDEDCQIVLIHDGARPFVTSEVIGGCLNSAKECGSGVCGVGVKDTIKVVDESGKVVQTLNRANLMSVQTPQAFSKKLIVDAHNFAKEKDYLGTDDASVVEFFGKTVQMVEGDYDNIKITSQEDLAIGENILLRRG